ncbi:MAG: flagellar brake protein [Pseudomonadales bacterium]|nr:flagellar brake protein [Pseudomonadales bacterium]
MNKGVRTASVLTLEPTRLLLVSGNTFKKVIAKSVKLNTQLESIGKEQQEIRKKHRKLQLLNRLVQSRSSVSLGLPRIRGSFSSLCLAVDLENKILRLDEVVSEYRNPVLVGDTISVTVSLSGTP